MTDASDSPPADTVETPPGPRRARKGATSR